MLVLSRRTNESIIIGDNIEVKIVEVKGDHVKLGITAPRHIAVHRHEIYDAIKRENEQAAKTRHIDEKKVEEKLAPEKKIRKKRPPSE